MTGMSMTNVKTECEKIDLKLYVQAEDWTGFSG